MEEKEKKFSKDFILVVIGQIISLFGNAVMRFALPLHLLDVTGSAALLGVVSGLAFLPLALMAPIGGLIADRVNKRNIMVALDFFTAGLVIVFALSYGKFSLTGMILIVLFLLYGISGAYQPSVQASIPLLVSRDGIMQANAVVNMISSLSGLLGPALGGMVYAAWGILPVLYVCIVCFLFSAVMEVFIKIPFTKRTRTSSMLKEAAADLKDGIRYISGERREIGRLTFCCAGVNLVLSALMIIGLPVIVMNILKFPAGSASRLYGYLEAVIAAGGLTGGLAAGIFGSKMNMKSSGKLLMICGALLFPMAAVLGLNVPAYLAYGVLAAMGLLIMACSSMYSITVLAFVQMTTPPEMTGKVISWIFAISSCALPAGQVVYGFLFDRLKEEVWIIFAVAAVISIFIGWQNKKISAKL